MSAVVKKPVSAFDCPNVEEQEEFRGFRETEMVPMATTSEESSDSNTSSEHFSRVGGSVGQVRNPEKTACMQELAELFRDDSDSEHDAFHGFTESNVNLSNMIGVMSMESESDSCNSMEVPQPAEAVPSEAVPAKPARVCLFNLRVMLRFPMPGKPAAKNDNQKPSPPSAVATTTPATPRKRGRPATRLVKGKRNGQSQRRAGEKGSRPEPSVAQDDNINGNVNDNEAEEQGPGERDGPPETENPEQGSDSEGEAELEQKMDFLTRRALNIKENKAMLARLMADLKTMPGLMEKFSVRKSPPSKARRPPKTGMPASDGPVRRNPERSTRTSRRLPGLGPWSPPPTPPRLSIEERLRSKRKSSDSDDDEDENRPRQRRGGFYSTSTIQHVVRAVDEITEDELSRIATSCSDRKYDKFNGTTCHQCRQKTSDTKTGCRNTECWGVRGQFCGPCLRNRYGEDVRTALLDPAWHCPPCRGICNCSFCRRRDGRCATGILIHLAKYHGYNNAQAYLESLQKEIDGDD